MFSNWLTWRAACVALDEHLRGSRIVSVFTQQKGELLLELAGSRHDVHLHLSVQPNFTWLLPKTELARARKNSLDLFPSIAGDVLASITIASNDRIVRIALDSGRTLYASLIPARGNLFLYDAQGELLDQFKRGGVPVHPASLRYCNDFTFPDRGEIRSVLDAGPSIPPLNTLKALRPWLQGALAREILFRAALPAERAEATGAAPAWERLPEVMEELREELHAGASHVYSSGGVPTAFSLVTLRHVENSEHFRCADVLEGLSTFVRNRWAASGFTATRDRVLRAAGRELDKAEKKLSLLPSESDLKLSAEQWKKFGNLLMIHLLDTPSQHDRMLVPDLFVDPRLIVSIPLTPGSTVLENAQRYFGKAQSASASLEYVAVRRKWLMELHDQLRTLISESTLVSNAAEMRETLAKHHTLLRRIGLTDKGTRDTNPFPFRRFIVAGGFEVWAGKSSANNDALTVRHARPNDIWFHARGVGGSHVVLKVGSAQGEPTKEAIRQAASIAAYYSKHRNAKNVPVAYTEKKYVRKPKGAAPGSVIMEREKVVMVQPMLPEGMSEE
ncbi:MAG: NFACT RNA binding domain-containing protein [Bacteroidia bacterium]|nr:NFACT RNA binding domain-containing protein [Bacteroidia bacterium]